MYLKFSPISQENTCVGVFGVFFNKVAGPPVATSESNRLVEKRVGEHGGGRCKYVNSIWDFSLFTEQGISGKKKIAFWEFAVLAVNWATNNECVRFCF